VDLGGEVLVGELRSTVADDDIAIGSVADRCLLSGVKQKFHFKGVRTVFDPSGSQRLYELRLSLAATHSRLHFGRPEPGEGRQASAQSVHYRL
jgi:hypothetical protein